MLRELTKDSNYNCTCLYFSTHFKIHFRCLTGISLFFIFSLLVVMRSSHEVNLSETLESLPTCDTCIFDTFSPNLFKKYFFCYPNFVHQLQQSMCSHLGRGFGSLYGIYIGGFPLAPALVFGGSCFISPT